MRERERDREKERERERERERQRDGGRIFYKLIIPIDIDDRYYFGMVHLTVKRDREN